MKRVFVFSIMLCLIFTFLTSISYARVIDIPGDFDTIQDGIDAAKNDGDIVMVHDGIWTGEGNKNLMLDNPDRMITVTSENGANSTIINCEGDGIGFIFSGESSVVDGFTIMNGNTPSDYIHGGGIACLNAYPEILNNIIIYNTASLAGGGIVVSSGGPRIINNLIARNSAGTRGGGITITDGAFPTIINNTITENSSGEPGGGIFCYESEATVINSIIWGNDNSDIVIPSGYTVYISYSVYDTKEGEGNLIDEGGMLEPGTDPLLDGDYRLDDYSPCIGAGIEGDAPTDIEGNLRGEPPDMGAYESHKDMPLFDGTITIISPADGDEFSTDDVVDVVAEVEDAFGDPVADMKITFEAIGGTIEPTTATTEENGQATTKLTVVEGENIVIAELEDDISDSITVYGYVDAEAEIYSVEVEGSPAKAGDIITVTLLGEIYGSATFSIDGVTDATDVQMTEETEGNYVGSYTAKEGDNVTEATVTATLTDNIGNIGTDETQTVTIDTIAKITSVTATGSPTTVGNTITVTLFGEADGSATFSIAGITDATNVAMTEETEGNYVGSYTAKEGDNVTEAIVTVRLTDNIGNIGTDETQTVTIDTVIDITSVTVTGSPAKAGGIIKITLLGEANGTVAFSITGVTDATDVAMTEETPGNYVGSYNAKEGDDVEDAIVTVTLADAVGNEASMDATEKVTIDTVIEITSVTATGSPAKALDIIEFTLVGEANGTATFSIAGVTGATDVAMTEETPGNYVGSYTAKEGDNVTEAIVIATLIDTVGNIGTDETRKVTIDTTPPIIESAEFDKEKVTEGEKVLLTVITETGAIVTADVSALDTTQIQPVTLVESTELPGTFTVDIKANADLGNKVVTITAKDAVGNVTTPPKEVTIELITFVFNLTLNAGSNMISIPLANATVEGATEPIRKVEDLGKILGDMWTLIISLDTKTGKFQSFTPKTPGDAKANIDITGTTGLIVMMKQAMTLTLQGEPWLEGNIKLNTGLNFIGIPLKNENLEKVIDLSTLLGDSVNVIISLDTETGKFQSFTPRTPEESKSNIIIDGGVGLILAMKSANEIFVIGEPWSNEN